jgi:acetyl esterase
MRWYWRNFLGSEDERTSSLAAPLRSDLSGLPPLYLSAAGLDPLRDDTLALGARLGEAGVPFRWMARELDAARGMIAAGADFIAARFKHNNPGGTSLWSAAVS